MKLSLWLISMVVAAAFLVSGARKITRSRAELIGRGQAWAESVSETGIKAIGAAEMAGAAGLLLPAATGVATLLTPLAALALAALMTCAAVLHQSRGEGASLAPPLVLAALCFFIAWGRLRTSPGRIAR